MVKGMAIFKRHFRSFADKYVLIGGTACDLAMDAVGVAFRATKDLDIVLCIEALDAAFVQAFWAFVRAGDINSDRRRWAVASSIGSRIRQTTITLSCWSCSHAGPTCSIFPTPHI